MINICKCFINKYSIVTPSGLEEDITMTAEQRIDSRQEICNRWTEN